ncbi:hypothetical protein JCM5296_005465 [Sporobolomyces johnsonii]
MPSEPGVLLHEDQAWREKQASDEAEQATPLDVAESDIAAPQVASRQQSTPSFCPSPPRCTSPFSPSPPLPSPEHFTNKRRQRARSTPLHVSDEERKPKRIKEPVVLILDDDDDDDEGHNEDSDESLEAFLGRLSSVFNLAQYAQVFRGKVFSIETPQQLLKTAADNHDELICILKATLGLGPASALRRGLEDELVRRGEL